MDTNNINDFESLDLLLNRPYDNLMLAANSNIKRKTVLELLERAESRLCFLNVINERPWHTGPRVSKSIGISALDRPQSNETSLSQAIINMDGILVKQLSKNTPMPQNFPFMMIMEKILLIKLALTVDPMRKMIYRSILKAIKAGRAEIPNIVVIPRSEDSMIFWYKTYALYKVILPIIEFPEAIMSQLRFQKNWLEKDEALNVILSAYGVHAKLPPEKMTPFISDMEIKSRTMPSLRSVMYAVSNRTA